MMTTLKRTTKDIKEALRNNCWYVYLECAGSALPRRVIDCRVSKGALQVLSMNDCWYDVTDSALYTG